jgi:predicted ATPase
VTDRIPGAAGHARGGGPALLEREPVLDVLLGAVATAAAGHGCAAILTGEAGIGKTSMVRALRASLDHGVRVLAGACDDLLSPRALGPLREAAAGTTGPLGSPGAGTASPMRCLVPPSPSWLRGGRRC